MIKKIIDKIKKIRVRRLFMRVGYDGKIYRYYEVYDLLGNFIRYEVHIFDKNGNLIEIKKV